MTIPVFFLAMLMQEAVPLPGLPPPPPPPPPPKSHTVVGAGSMTCRTYLKARGKQRAAARNWVTGYLTGLNQYGPDADGLIAPYTEFSEYAEGLEKHCRYDLDNTIDWAARELGDDLVFQRNRP